MRTLLLFKTTHDVIKAERLCRKAGLPVQVIPVPREISSECGMALEPPADRIEQTVICIHEAGIATETIELENKP